MHVCVWWGDFWTSHLDASEFVFETLGRLEFLVLCMRFLLVDAVVLSGNYGHLVSSLEVCSQSGGVMRCPRPKASGHDINV
jgi:hypothetical protein